jgi:hypothetical protein
MEPKVINMEGPGAGTVSNFQDTVQTPSWFEQNITGPLKKLTVNKYDFIKLQYPADLHGRSKGGHRVQFDFFDAQSVGLPDDVVNKVKNTAKDALATGSKGVDAIETAFNSNNFAETLTKYVGNAAESATEAATKFRGFIKNQKDYKTSVSLYMPDTLVFNQAAEYGEISILGAATSVPGIGAVASGIQSVLNNEALKLVLNKAGYAFNPQAQALFQGIHFRTFNMSFTFTPRSAQEAEQVKKIIKTFRTYAAPTILDASAGFFYKPPGIINVTFCNELDSNLSEGTAFLNQNILQLADCVLTSVDINYAPSGWSAHKDGHPIQTTMDLSFQEIELIDRQMIEKGY